MTTVATVATLTTIFAIPSIHTRTAIPAAASRSTIPARTGLIADDGTKENIHLFITVNTSPITPVRLLANFITITTFSAITTVIPIDAIAGGSPRATVSTGSGAIQADGS